jgi:hypothetical protein
MSPFTNFFKKSTKAVGNFFKKDVGKPVGNFFKKGGAGERVLGGYSRGMSTIGNIASKIASNPATSLILAGVAPELLPFVPALGLAGKTASLTGDATNLKNYKGMSNQQKGQNLLEKAKMYKSIGDDASKLKFS